MSFLSNFSCFIFSLEPKFKIKTNFRSCFFAWKQRPDASAAGRSGTWKKRSAAAASSAVSSVPTLCVAAAFDCAAKIFDNRRVVGVALWRGHGSVCGLCTECRSTRGWWADWARSADLLLGKERLLRWWRRRRWLREVKFVETTFCLFLVWKIF